MSLNKRLLSRSQGVVRLDDTDPLGQGTDTLVAFYDFNGNVNDSSGHNNNGTNTANGILSGNYLEIDGVGNDYITLGRTYSIGESVSFWFNLPTAPGVSTGYRLFTQYYGDYYRWDFVSLVIDEANTTLTLGVYARYSGGYSYKTAVVDSNFTFGEWHLITINFTAFNSSGYSYDGADLATMTALNGSNGSTFYSNSGLLVGTIYSNGVSYYNSSPLYLDKFRIFSSALTNAQVQILYSETPNT